MAAKILIIRFSSIGDILLTTPVVRCISRQMSGGAAIHYLTRKKYADILSGNPHIEKVYAIESSVGEVMSMLRREDYHFIVDLHNNFRSWQVKRMLRALSFSVNKMNLRKWLLVNFKWDFMPSKHLVDRYMETAAPLGIRGDGGGLDFFLSPEDEVPPEKLPSGHREGYVVFAIGARHATKRLPPEKITAICQKSRKPLLLLGDEQDAAIGDAVASRAGDPVFNGCGKFSLRQSAYLISRAEKVVAHDSGLMHIAAAFNREVISIWGNTVPEFGMTPYYGEKHEGRFSLFQIKTLPCRPCSKLGYPACPREHFRCMRDLNEDEIAGTIDA